MMTQPHLTATSEGAVAPASLATQDLEQLIEEIGARYITDLRTLSQALDRYYTAELKSRDEQIAKLVSRAESAERERDRLEAQVNELKHLHAAYIDNLRALSETLKTQVVAPQNGPAPDNPTRKEYEP